MCFPVNFVKFLRIRFLTERFWWLFRQLLLGIFLESLLDISEICQVTVHDTKAKPSPLIQSELKILINVKIMFARRKAFKI